MNKTLALLAAAATLILASCAGNYPAEEDALAKSFTPRPGRANVYIHRPLNMGLGAAALIHLDLDGKQLETVPMADRFCVLDIRPGKHTLCAYTKNIAGLKLGKVDHSFAVDKGRNIFLKMSPLPTFNAIVASTPVVWWSPLPDAEGRTTVMNSKLSEAIETVD